MTLIVIADAVSLFGVNIMVSNHVVVHAVLGGMYAVRYELTLSMSASLLGISRRRTYLTI
jgi:hypothetical protein